MERTIAVFAHTDAAYLIADSILGELTFVRQALDAAGCERVYASGDEAEALTLIERVVSLHPAANYHKLTRPTFTGTKRP